MTDDNTLTLDTTKGKVVIQMRPDLAPGHVARIKELVRDGFYDGIVFHRVIDGFMAQTGCPQGTGTGGSGKKLKAEFNKEPHRRGTVSMARAQNPDSGDSQFFICFADAPVSQRPIHRLGPGDGRHGERRQDQAGRARVRSGSHHLRKDVRGRLITAMHPAQSRRGFFLLEWTETEGATRTRVAPRQRPSDFTTARRVVDAAPLRTPRLPWRTIRARSDKSGNTHARKKTGVASKLLRSVTIPWECLVRSLGI
jgi:peptidylprolyl isomerase